ncbi:hypothetical protein GGX14DRAFT_538325 [Mycena pura]|uniref:Uncharacterized protein n=1 Tax=Mycena pura TaxID=153505 RepID=A0AAD6YUV0_9AGAR|nr:hypothetical protein GGX14DRAFT_538325 [Mycena pura]
MPCFWECGGDPRRPPYRSPRGPTAWSLAARRGGPLRGAYLISDSGSAGETPADPPYRSPRGPAARRRHPSMPYYGWIRGPAADQQPDLGVSHKTAIALVGTRQKVFYRAIQVKEIKMTSNAVFQDFGRKVVVLELKKKKLLESLFGTVMSPILQIEQPLSLTALQELHSYWMYWGFSGS